MTYNDDVSNRRRWIQAQALTDHFWMKEYLPTLTIRKTWYKNSNDEVKVGDLVLVVEQNVPRGKWPLGRIIKTYPGDDEITRVVDVKIKNGVFRCPVSRLCQLSR